MEHNAKRIVSILTSILITTASLIGIPLKSYINRIHYDPKCVEAGPLYWTPRMAKVYARGYMNMMYPQWNRSEWKALDKLWTTESHWNHKARNPQSTAYGIAQVLNTKHGTPAPLQIERGLAYIQHRYGKPSVAWTFHRKHNYY